MNLLKLDNFYQEVVRHVDNYLRDHRLLNRGETELSLSADEIFREQGVIKYEDISQATADIGLLVGVALEVQGSRSNGKIRESRLTYPVMKDALVIYKGKIIPNTPEDVIGFLELCFSRFQHITGEDENSFVKLIRNAYSSAGKQYPIEVPKENPEDFAIKSFLRQKISNGVRKIEYEFSANSLDRWQEKVLSGDVSDYAIPIIHKMLQYDAPRVVFENESYKAKMKKIGAKLAIIDELTELPILEIIEKGKNTFPNTYQHNTLDGDEISKTITDGLNKYLDILKEYHKQYIKNYGDSLYVDDVKHCGKEGCLFGHRIGEEGHIILNSEIVGWGCGGLVDVNSWYSPKNFLLKINILGSDGYIDFNGLKNEWLSSAVNEYISKWTASLITGLDSEHPWGISYCKDELNKLAQFSQVAHPFVREESKNHLKKLEDRLKEDI